MNRAARFALTPLSGLYRAAMAGRRALYRRGVLTTHEVATPVISVGNITTGGTGKTPLVEWIARELASHHQQICILTRGYGRKHPHQRVVVTKESTAEEAGDEAVLLAERLTDHVIVISDADRVAAAEWAKNKWPQIEAFVLDDGFQHLRIARTLNIVTIDASNPWGNGQLLPAGILREAPRELSRADCIVITRADDPEQSEQLSDEIRKLSPKSSIFRSRMKIGSWRLLNSNGNDLGETLKATPAAAFCAIGNPESFFDHLRRDGLALTYTRAFRDHHAYTQADVDLMLREATACGAQILLTTAKDEVKLRTLRFALPCYVADLDMEIENEDKLRALIATALDKR